MTDKRRKDGTSLTDLRELRHQMPIWVLVLVALSVAAVIASRVTNLLMMLIASAVIAYIFSSVVSAIERLGIKRSVAVILLFVLATAFAIAADHFFIPDLRQESMNAYAKFPDFLHQIRDALLLSAQSAEKFPFIKSSIIQLVDNVFGPSGFLERTRNASELLMQATPLILGLLASAGLWLIGINYPIMLGILSGVANIVPYLGPIIGCTVSSLVALMQYRSFDPVLNVVVLYFAIKLMDDLVI